MISTEKGLQDTAIYSIAFYIAILIEIPKRGVLQIAAPIVSKHMKDKNISELDTLYKKASLAIFSVCTVLFFLIGFNLPLIMSFIPKGEIYQQGSWVVLIIGLGKVIEVIGLLAYPIISNSNYYTYGFISSVVNIFIAIVFNYILIPLYGINGAAIATFLTFVVSMMIQTVIVFKKIGIQPFTKEHVKTILVALFSLGLIIIFKMKEFDLIGLILGNVLMYAIYVAWYYKSAYKTEVKNLVLNAFKRS
jgi:O-antigen/teichoic acid export membrane protein